MLPVENHVNKSVEKLRKSGYKVRVYHIRRINMFIDTIYGYEAEIMSRREFESAYQHLKFGQCVDSYGGFTMVEIDTPEGENLKGKFNVPSGHQFNRKLGLRVAIGRAFCNRKVVANV
jgi:hypothetical protein